MTDTLSLKKDALAPKTHPQWEYNVRFVDATTSVYNTLEPMGNDGWELCTTRPTGAVNSGNFELIFKRRK